MSTDDFGERQEDGGDDVLVAEYVLGLLGPVEHQAFRRRVAAEPELQRLAAFWGSRFAALDGEFAEATPPQHVLDGLERRLFAPSRPALHQGGWWNSLKLWRGLAGAALAVAVLSLGAHALRPVPLDPDATAMQLVAALAEEGSNISFVAFYDSRTGLVRLASMSGEPVPDRDFELWAIQGGKAPVSMGVIAIGGRSEVQVSAPVLEAFGPGSVLAVTLEPRGGSPSGAPTGPVVAKGEATLI